MTTSSSPPPVLVGVSGSVGGRSATVRAAHEAASRGCALRLLRVWPDVGWLTSMTQVDIARLRSWEAADRALLADAIVLAEQAEPGIELRPEWVAGDLYTHLLQAGRDAAVVVVGEGGQGEDPDSLAVWLRRHTSCPVLCVAPGAPLQETR